jgi:hypothetical protein
MVFSLEVLNNLPKLERDSLYLQLIPPTILHTFHIDPRTLTNRYGEKVVKGIFPPSENLGCIDVKYRAEDKDCIFSLQVSLDLFMKSVHIDFLTINDPFSERFNVDVDESGGETLFGSRSRNIPEEAKAMEAGLAPGMVRHGLRSLGESLKCIEAFAVSIGLKTLSLGALFYHNAILWEKHGFIYFKGGKVMERIHKEFQPGGLLCAHLDDSTPFRRRGMEKTVRGRSWAIYDGILEDAFDEEWENPNMYKMLEKDFKVNTFPDQIY